MLLRQAQGTLWIIKITVLSTTDEDSLPMIFNKFLCTSSILFIVLKFYDMNQSPHSVMLLILLGDSYIYGINQLISFWRVIVISSVL